MTAAAPAPTRPTHGRNAADHWCRLRYRCGDGAPLYRRRRPGSLLDRDRSSIDALAVELPGALAFGCDVTDEKQVGVAVRAARAELGHIDGLVNSAGIADSGPLASWSVRR